MHMNFFSAGGTSLLAGMVALKLNEAFGCDESATLLFNHPTIEGVAAKMEGLPTGTITKQVSGSSYLTRLDIQLLCTGFPGRPQLSAVWPATSPPLAAAGGSLPERCF